jgi:hypothetical protein
VGVVGVGGVVVWGLGVVVPFLVFQLFVHQLIWIAALWAVTFPGATWALALWFRRKRESPAS